MKHPIAWHKEVLFNMTATYAREREYAEHHLKVAVNGETKCLFYSAQISEAETRGLDDFDEERFMKGRKP